MMKLESKVLPSNAEPENKNPAWLPAVIALGLGGLIIFEVWAYGSRLNLSLGPRVILQPWMLQNGFVPYEHIVDLHSPLMPMIIAALRQLETDGLKLAKLVLLSLITLTTVLTYITGWRKIDPLWGLWAAWFFVLWSHAFGFGKLWYETFLAPIFIIWILAYQPSCVPQKSKLLILCGFLGGIAVLIKQTAVVAFLAFVFWQVFTSWYTHRSASMIIRQLVMIGMAAVAPILVFLVGYYAKTGSLADLFYWVIGYHLEGRYITYSVEPLKLVDVGRIASCFILVPFAAVCAFDLMRRRDRNWLNFGLGLLILITGAVSAYPRFAFFHLQSVLPVVALLSAMTLSYAFRQLRSWRIFAFGMVVAFSAFFFVKAGVFYRPAFRADRHPFVDEYSDLLPLAQEIRSTIGETESVYVFPDDEASANLYYLLQRKPPEFWIFHYNWYLLDWTKAKILATLEADPPDWVVYFRDSWGAEEAAPEIVRYIQDHYSLIGNLDWEQGKVRLFKRVP